MLSKNQTETSLLKFPTWLVFIIILLEGFVTISAEILVIRQLIPMVGTSVVVTSLIIGVFLLFLAYGYRRGGLITINFQTKLVQNFTYAACLLGIGLSYVFIEQLFITLNIFTKHHVLWSLIIYLLLIIAPLVYILGQTVPITMNLCGKEERAGQIGGKVLHLSTIGSFLGSVLTSLVLINYLGVAWTVVINFLLLVVLVLLVIEKHNISWQRLAILAICALITWYLNVNVTQQFFLKMNNYGNYTVLENFNFSNNETEKKEPGKVLLINNSFSSFLNSKNEAFSYIETVRQILFHQLKLQHKQILVLGAGGFTLSAKNTHDNQFTYVDIDPQLKKIVSPAFIANIHGQFIGEDARVYLASSSKKYDVIFSDVCTNKQTIPAALLSLEYFLAIRHALNKEGYAIFNIIADPLLNSSFAKRVDNTIRAAFGNCMAIPLIYANQKSNIIYVCHKAKNSNDQQIYTDNKNSAMIDYYFT